MDSFATGLNAQQQRAVVHGDGPLLVLAGPGSGKTRVIAHRIVRRIQVDGIVPARILALTFTNRAAREMRTRVRTLTGEDSVAIGTFHWASHAILRRYSDRLDIRRDFRLLAQGDSRRVLRLAMGEAASHYRVADVAAALSAVKNGGDLTAEARRYRVPPSRLTLFAQAYEREMRRLGAVDLDDLLAKTAVLLREHSAVRKLCKSRYDEILVDEYQDTNAVQREILRALAPPGGTVVVVGDQDQSIYGWRGADSSTMERFLDDFPGAGTVKLEESYRSTKHILRAASTLVEHNSGRIGKSLRTSNAAGDRPVCFAAGDEGEEAEWVASAIEHERTRHARAWEDVVVLYRVNAQSRAIEDAFLRHGIPYHVSSGYRFYERPEIRRVVSYLRLAVDEGDDEAAVALLEGVAGMGPRRLAIVRAEAGESPLMRYLALNRPRGIPAPVVARLTSLAVSVAEVRSARMSALPTVVEAAILPVAAGLDDLAPLERETALDNLNELRSVVAEMAGARGTVREFLARFVLTGSAGDDGQGVHLMSLHAAKGLEFDVVFLTGLEEGLLPHRRSLDSVPGVEEERRLCYVGMTRAREMLYLSYAHARLLGGQFQIGHVSRFVAEMGRGNVALRVSPTVSARPRLAAVTPGERVTHPRWHDGTVEAVEGTGRDTMVRIAFDDGTTQTVQLRHAPLTRLRQEKPRVLAG